ncbi:hypothetical protein GQ457_07G010020 [Hibiscus cannabinus]
MIRVSEVCTAVVAVMAIVRFNPNQAGNSLWAQGILLGRFRCFGSGNSLWTFVGYGASPRVIPHGLLFRCFGLGNPLWNFLGSDAKSRVIPYGLGYGLNRYLSEGNKCTHDQLSAPRRDPVILALVLQWNIKKPHFPLLAVLLLVFISSSILYNEFNIQQIHESPDHAATRLRAIVGRRSGGRICMQSRADGGVQGKRVVMCSSASGCLITNHTRFTKTRTACICRTCWLAISMWERGRR